MPSISTRTYYRECAQLSACQQRGFILDKQQWNVCPNICTLVVYCSMLYECLHSALYILGIQICMQAISLLFQIATQILIFYVCVAASRLIFCMSFELLFILYHCACSRVILMISYTNIHSLVYSKCYQNIIVLNNLENV
jgi:hypothetical protein